MFYSILWTRLSSDGSTCLHLLLLQLPFQSVLLLQSHLTTFCNSLSPGTPDYASNILLTVFYQLPFLYFCHLPTKRSFCVLTLLAISEPCFTLFLQISFSRTRSNNKGIKENMSIFPVSKPQGQVILLWVFWGAFVLH